VLTGTSTTYSWTGGTNTYILNTGVYTVTYKIRIVNENTKSSNSVGAYLMKNGVAVAITGAAATVTKQNSGGELVLPTVILQLNAGDVLTVIGFTSGGDGGVVTTVPNEVFLMVNRLS